MKLPFSLFLALKYLRPKRTFVSVVTLISVLGVLLGVAVLVIVLSVMSGFDDMWRDKILGFNAHLTVTGWGIMEDEDAVMERLAEVPGVKGTAPFVQGLVFIQHEDHVYTPVMRGIDPEMERRISQIPAHMAEGVFSVEDDEVILGRDLAARVGAGLGDRILVYSPKNFTVADELRLPEELTVSGIFELGMWDFDMGFMLTSLDTARSMYSMERGVHGIQVMTGDPFRAPSIAARMQVDLGPEYEVQTWMDMNRQLFSALKVEKNMMFFLLIIISVVAAFGITNTLITLAVQKTKEVGLLKALGFSSGGIMRVFLWQGWICGVLGTLSGMAAGLLVLYYRNDLMSWMNRRLGMELLPKDLYHLSEIPSTTSLTDVAMVALVVVIICTLAGLVPAWRAARLDPARALHYE
ncbi:MAG TPA: ABC transporter permease [Kiritimatiellia bacterium]|nr:ABC transporter permease [Kiritimatiellia bacterium]HPA78133.1 ABC transporter permease [Kiritimatiellia bacterium]